MSDPDRAVDRQVRLDIQARGYHVGIVPAVPGACGWAFSVGLPASADHPEVIAFGPDLDLVGGLVQRLCDMVRAGQDFSGRERHGGVLAGHDVATRPLAPKWTSIFLGNAAWYHGREDFPALQCFWPDAGGHFPWEAAFDAAWRDEQPHLYESLTHKALPDGLLASLRAEGAL